MNLAWLELTVAGLACFRLALLLSDDSGPYRFLAKFRSYLRREEKRSKALRKSDVIAGVECIRCNSVWIAGPVVAFLFAKEQLPQWLALAGWAFLLWNALSAAAILINRALPPKS